MERRPGFWTYAAATGTAIGLSLAAGQAFGISGRADVALTIALLAGAVYLVTPADQRDQAKRLWGMVAFALGGLIAGSAAGALLGVTIAPEMLLDPETAEWRGEALVAVWAASIGLAICVHLAVFAFGWPLVKPRAPEAEASPDLSTF